MTAQPDLWTHARKRRDAGEASALSHYFVEHLLFEICHVVRTMGEATSDDVMEALNETQRLQLATAPNTLGACFHLLAKQGKILDSGKMVRSRRPEARQRKIAVWRCP